MSTELELRLNGDDIGTDLAYLQKSLLRLFERRTELRAFKVGMETRTDIPLEERIEKIVFVKAPLSVRYGDVLRVIDAVKGAGANPIGLQVDDLVR
jgi:biopolymer transport protein ExbD